MILQNLAAYDYVVKDYDTTEVDAGLSMGVILALVAFALLMIASMWRIYTKAGRPGWSAIVPIYSSLQLIWTAGKPWWWLLLLCIPFLNFIVLIVLYYNLAKAFGKGGGYTLLLVFLPFIGFPMLAWGNATYRLKKPQNGM